MELGFQQLLQVGVELGLGWELGRMITAFTLREIAIHDGNWLAVSIGKGAPDKTPLSFFVIAGKALVQAQRRLARKQGDAVMALLAVVMHVIAEGSDVGKRELLVGNLGFLQADDIRLVLVDQGGQLMRTGTQAVDIE